MPTILAFDTATASGSVAVSHQGKVVAESALMPRQHSQRLLPMIEQLLQRVAIQVADLDAIAFTHGPGSFMGVRLATGFAQGLAFSADIPLIAISTLRVLAQTALLDVGATRVLAAWDARMDSLYWGGYQADPAGLMQVMVDDCLTPAKDWHWPGGEWQCVGNAWGTYAATLSPALANCQQIHAEICPRAEAMLALAQAAYRDQQTVSPLSVQPSYLRHHVANKPSS